MRDASHYCGGYIRLYRSLLDWEWFQDSTTLHVFLFLLLSACFKPIRHAGMDLAPGQLITARRVIAQRTGLTESQVRTALKHLESTHEITLKSNRHFSLITLTNFDRYQHMLSPTDLPAVSPTDRQPFANRSPNNKNDNHVNQEKKKGDSPYGHGIRNEHGNDRANRYAGVGVCV